MRTLPVLETARLLFRVPDADDSESMAAFRIRREELVSFWWRPG